MGVSKLDVSVVERVAPDKGPTSSSDYNATLQEIINDLSQVSLSWNDEVQPLLDSLPSGRTTVIREDRTDDPDPFKNGLDGSQVYLDSTSTTLTDSGKYFSENLDRPLTIKESMENVQDQLNDAIQDLQVEIAQVSAGSGITSRQRQAIGSRIFDPETVSSPTSLDGLTQGQIRNVDQLGLDMSGDANYLNGSGVQTLTYAVLQQLQAIKDAHDYDSVFNTMTHNHLPAHAHKYHIDPIGDLNGINKTYLLPGVEVFIAGSLRVVLNGAELRKGTGYTERPDLKGFEITPAHRALENDGIGSDDYVWIHYDVEA